MSDQIQGRAGPGRGAVRMVFRFQGQQLEMLSQVRVDATALPSDPMVGFGGHRGFWLEVRDSGGLLLHRRVMSDPTQASVEVYPDGGTAPLGRRPLSASSGVFAVLVPDLAQADHLAFVASPEGRGRRRVPAAEIGRFPLSAPSTPSAPSTESGAGR